MRSWVILAVWGCLCTFAQAQCSTEGGDSKVPFPNIEKKVYESYYMAVEYTAPGAQQTDYYTEYYDVIAKKGHVDAHQAGKSLIFLYNAPSFEAWEVSGWTCEQKFINETPQMFQDVQNDWLYFPQNTKLTTIGPSAMFKIAYDKWANTVNSSQPSVYYMGKYEKEVRGIKGVYWRRCDGDESYVDYIFTDETYVNSYDMKDFKTIPLRVFFGGKRPERSEEFVIQQYDIVQFQPFVSPGLRPFDLPRGKGCTRRDFSDDEDTDDIPKPPDFAGRNLQFGAEVIYQNITLTDRKSDELLTYYNTLRMSLDVSSQHLAYHYAPWDKNAPKSKPDVTSPIYTIFDMKHGYLYKYDLITGECQLIRERNFVPQFQLPEGLGSITLTDPDILFPNDESVFISEGVNRGLKVNVFEKVGPFVMNDKDGKPIAFQKAIITHTYLQNDEVERNVNSVKNALTQVQLRIFGRKPGVMDVVTMNFYGFSTEIRNRRQVFNVKRCYKNDDDYVWITLTFNADEAQLKKIKNDVPSIQSNILNSISMSSELNAARIPIIEVDFRDSLYVTMQVLGKPPVLFDYLAPVKNKRITGTKEQEGISDTNTCATKCLESEGVCWGFSMCGAVCTFGADSSAKVEDITTQECYLYTRDNGSFIPSTELMIQNLRRQVNDGMLNLVLLDKDSKAVQLQASSIEVTDPGEDDRLFERVGNILNPRMKVVKVGNKLKSTAGATVKNMGRLRYDECQRICLDFRDCETVSYCLKNSECILSKTYGADLAPADLEADNMCNVITRKYADNFDRSPGNVLTLGAQEILPIANVEDCARACLNRKEYKCLSFDHCPTEEKDACFLHTVHYPNPTQREKVVKKSTNCGHYIRKFSTEFKKNADKRTIGSKIPPLTNLTLEQCARECIEYGKGTCFGYDFCQGSTILATSCTLLDSDPNKMQLAYSPICNNFFRTEIQSGPPRPYSSSYAGGIGFLCFLIGSLVGAAIVFGIAYLRVNRS